MEHENTPTIQLKRPDWKNLSEYDYLIDASAEQFAWEFLRRNANYQKDYKKYRHFPSSKALDSNKDNKDFFYKYFESNPSNRRKESYSDYSARIKEEGKILPSGAISSYYAKRGDFIEKYDLAHHEDMSIYSPRNQNSPGFSYFDEEYPIFTRSSRMGGLKINLKEDFNDEIVIKFSLLLSINDQLEKAKAEMDRRFECMVKGKLKDTQYPDDRNYLLITYLRILDALKTNADIYYIIFHIYSSRFRRGNYEPKSPEEIKNPLLMNLDDKGYQFILNQAESSRLKFQKDKKKAIEFRDGDYVWLARSVSHYLNKALDTEETRIMKEI